MKKKNYFLKFLGRTKLSSINIREQIIHYTITKWVSIFMHRLDQQPVNINTFETRWCGEECFANKVFKLNVALYNAKFLSFFIVTHR